MQYVSAPCYRKSEVGYNSLLMSGRLHVVAFERGDVEGMADGSLKRRDSSFPLTRGRKSRQELVIHRENLRSLKQS